MKFKIMRGELLKELQRVQTIAVPVEKTAQNPIISHLRVTVADNMLEIFATNLEIGYRNRLPVMGQKEGSMTLDARKTFEIFRELSPEGEVEVDEGTKGWAVISMPGVQFRVSTMPGEDFPAAPAYTDKGFITARAGILRELIAKTEFAISHDDSMRTLSGAHFRFTGDKISMVATDGHRLAKIEKKGKAEAKGPEAIIPRRAVVEIKKLLEELEEDAEVQLKQEGDHLIVKSGSIIFYCRLIKGKFPDYNQVIPAEFSRQVLLNRERFLRALRRVSILSNERSKPVILQISGNKMEARSNSPEMGEAKEELDIELNGEEIEAGYNARYIIEALGAIEEEEVIFELIDVASASLLRGKGNEEYLCVIMPMRV